MFNGSTLCPVFRLWKSILGYSNRFILSSDVVRLSSCTLENGTWASSLDVRTTPVTTDQLGWMDTGQYLRGGIN
jgi:hypothetical protein